MLAISALGHKLTLPLVEQYLLLSPHADFRSPLNVPPKNHSGVSVDRHGMISPAAVILLRSAEKNLRAPMTWRNQNRNLIGP